MTDYIDDMKESAARLSVFGGEIHLLCPAPTGPASTHTHMKIGKGTKIECGQSCLKIYYCDSPDRLCYTVPYSSIAYIYIKKK